MLVLESNNLVSNPSSFTSKLYDFCQVMEPLQVSVSPSVTQVNHFANKSPYSQSYGFPSSHVRMWELDHKEGWVPKNWCFRTVLLEKTLVSPLDSKEVKSIHPKGNQPWIFIGRTDAEAEVPILWPPDEKSQLTGKDPDARKDWGPEEKAATEDEMVR